jgi:NAD(P)H-nitrite reductase large subunit
MSYVIIGNSAAAVGAIEAIRKEQDDQPITVISDEPHHTYSRPLISHFLAGEIDEPRLYYRPPDFYERHNVLCLLGRKAISLDTQGKKVVLEDGGEIHFSKLLIATGSLPLVPPVAGRELAGVFAFTRWQDADDIKRFIQAGNVEKAVVVGGGLIGLKASEALVALNVRVTMVELTGRVLSLIFDELASGIAMKRLTEAGIEVRTSTTVEEVVGEYGRVSRVRLRDGSELPCQLVILAIGVRPNVSLVEKTAIEIKRGIVVDEYMRTSLPDVYAAGDVVETWDPLCGDSHPVAIWPNAYRQGSIAGSNIAREGRSMLRPYEGGFPMNSLEIFGLPTISVGLVDPPADGYEILRGFGQEEDCYKKLVLRRNRLVGALFVKQIERAGIFTSLIRDQVDVRPFAENLLDDSFGLISLPSEYRKHMVTGWGTEI